MKARKLASILAAVIVCVLVGAAISFASGGGDEPSPWTTSKLMWRVINTIALFALLTYFLKKPLVNFFTERTATIEKDLVDAKSQRDKAELLIKEYQEKIAGMEKELEKMRAELKKAAEAESVKVEANADRMAAGMIESAKIAAEQEVRKAKADLRNESVDMAVQMAEAVIREKISEDDQKRIFRDYLAKVEGMK